MFFSSFFCGNLVWLRVVGRWRRRSERCFFKSFFCLSQFAFWFSFVIVVATAAAPLSLVQSLLSLLLLLLLLVLLLLLLLSATSLRATFPYTFHFYIFCTHIFNVKRNLLLNFIQFLNIYLCILLAFIACIFFIFGVDDDDDHDLAASIIYVCALAHLWSAYG